MDPLSSTASTIAIIGFAGRTCQYLYEFLNTVSHAPKEIQQHASMLKALSSTLAAIENLSQHLPADVALSSEFCVQLSECMTDFRVAEDKMKKLNERLDKGHMRRTWARVRWFTSDQYLRSFFARMQVYHANFSLYLLTLNIKINLAPERHAFDQTTLPKSSCAETSVAHLVCVDACVRELSNGQPSADSGLESQARIPATKFALNESIMASGECFKPRITLESLDRSERPNQLSVPDSERCIHPTLAEAQSVAKNRHREGAQLSPKYNSNMIHFLQSQMELISVRSSYFYLWEAFSVKAHFWLGPALVKRWNIEQNPPSALLSDFGQGYGAALRVLIGFGQISLSVKIIQKPQRLPSQSISIRWNLSFARQVSNDAAVFQLARIGDIAGMKMLFQNGKASPSDVTQNGKTLLHVATRGDHDEVVRFLIDQGADVNSPDEDGETPLHSAIAVAQSFDVPRTLIDRGADLMYCNVEGKTPLHTLFNPVVETIFQYHGASIDEGASDSQGMTLLHFAAWSSQSSHHIFRRHAERRSDGFTSGIWSKDHSGRTVLHYAAQRGNVAVVEYVLGLGDNVDVNERDCDGRTALSYAAETKRCEVIDLLHRRGSRLRDSDSRGRTPLHHAARRGNLAGVDKLISLGSSGDVWLEDDNGATALRLASNLGVASVVSRLEELRNAMPKETLPHLNHKIPQQLEDSAKGSEMRARQQEALLSTARNQKLTLEWLCVGVGSLKRVASYFLERLIPIICAVLLWEYIKMTF